MNPSIQLIFLSSVSPRDPRIHMTGAKKGFGLGDELARAYLGIKGEGEGETKRQRDKETKSER